jgi:Lrp/AsnC family transcriptional regulator for asnA, asnC and gidA
MTTSVDEIDRKIIGALQKDARATNKAIAKEIGVSDVTVATRIRRLVDNKIFRTTVFYDVYKLGYKFYCVGEIWVEDRDVRSVAADMTKIQALQTVVTMIGGPDISVLFFARDHDEVDAVRVQISKVKGIKAIELILSLRLAKFMSSYGAYAMLKHDE